MGTHITIAEFILISVVSILVYAAVRAAYDTWFKKPTKKNDDEYGVIERDGVKYWYKK